MPERCRTAKTLLWTELGHTLQKFRLVGSKFGLSGLVKRLFVGYFLPPNPLQTADLCQNSTINRTDTLS